MKYYEIFSPDETRRVQESLRETYRPLSQLVASASTAETMRGTKVLTLYHRFEPVVKVEGSSEEVSRLQSWLGS
jgi:hypothetical protein